MNGCASRRSLRLVIARCATARCATARRRARKAHRATALGPAERELARLQPTERRRSQFALGRAAAHLAARRVLGPQPVARGDRPAIEVVSGPDGAPVVWVNGTPARDGGVPISVSISHSADVAAALAWRGRPGYGAGVDVERIRVAAIGDDDLVFSEKEVDLLAQLPEGRTAGLIAGWTVKEAVWKALWPEQAISPLDIQIASLSLASGAAGITWPTNCPVAARAVRVHLSLIKYAGEQYVCSVAEVLENGRWAI